MFLASDEMIENEPEVLEAFLRASARGFADVQSDPEEALRTLLDNQNEENFPLSETVERQSMEVLLPLMETAEAPFLSQSAACWQENATGCSPRGSSTRPRLWTSSTWSCTRRNKGPPGIIRKVEGDASASLSTCLCSEYGISRRRPPGGPPRSDRCGGGRVR